MLLIPNLWSEHESGDSCGRETEHTDIHGAIFSEKTRRVKGAHWGGLGAGLTVGWREAFLASCLGFRGHKYNLALKAFAVFHGPKMAQSLKYDEIAAGIDFV